MIEIPLRSIIIWTLSRFHIHDEIYHDEGSSYSRDAAVVLFYTQKRADEVSMREIDD